MSGAKLPSGQMLRWKQDEFPSVYANVMGFGMTPFDINLMFGELGETTPEGVTGIPRVKIILSPEQAANLAKLIGVALEAYVASNGPIRKGGEVDLQQVRNQVNEGQQQRVSIDEG